MSNQQWRLAEVGARFLWSVRTAAIVPLAALAVVAAAGCGSSSKTNSTALAPGTSSTSTVAARQLPKPTTSAGAWAGQLVKAAGARDCAAIKSLWPTANNCQKVLNNYGHAKLAGTEQFGTGAVVDFTGVRGAPGGSLTIMLGFNSDHKWEPFIDRSFHKPTVGTHVVDVGPFVQTQAAWFHAVATRNCATAFKYADVPWSQSKFCSTYLTPSNPVVTVIAANRSAKPIPLGGTADVQFFGYLLRLPPSVARKHGPTGAYATGAVLRVPPGEKAGYPYQVENLVPGPTPKHR